MMKKLTLASFFIILSGLLFFSFSSIAQAEMSLNFEKIHWLDKQIRQAINSGTVPPNESVTLNFEKIMLDGEEGRYLCWRHEPSGSGGCLVPEEKRGR